MLDYLAIDPYSWPAIGTAVFCGSIIGLERQLRGKPVGIRTSALITLGTYLFLATAFLVQGDSADNTRVIGQIVTGIGFLGAGVMLARDGAVIGVTSAASIWMLASIGVVIASGFLLVAIKVSLLAVAILYGVEVLEGHTRALTRGVHTHVQRYTRRGRADAES